MDQSTSLNKKSIVIADDDELFCELMKGMLEGAGYRVFTVQNGREAVDIALSIKPDLIILDVKMPKMGGLEACRLLKKDETTRDIPVIFMTANNAVKTEPNVPFLDARDVLSKEMPRAQLLERISNILSKGQLEKRKQDEAGPVLTQSRKPRDPYRLTGLVLNDKYVLTEYAGGGGMGAVYRGLKVRDGDVVAVKILKPDIVERSPEYAELFEREANNARSLNHPNIVQILDSDKDEDLSYMVMEWVEGSSIEDVIAQGQLPISRIKRIFEQVCNAVASAHQRGIIHLDLKPANILLVKNPGSHDHAMVIDFGLSRVISKESGTTVTKFRGTHQYCAPEQFSGRVSFKSDIYSLGATLYHLITGVIPFGTSYINAKIHPNLELPEIPSVTRQRNVSARVDLVIKKALDKNPDLRQQSVLQLSEEFSAIFEAEGRKEVSKINERFNVINSRLLSIKQGAAVPARAGDLIDETRLLLTELANNRQECFREGELKQLRENLEALDAEYQSILKGGDP